MPGIAEKANNINDEHSLGKGEVHSSILCGSTTKARFSETFPASALAGLTQSRRTKRETRKSTRGKVGDSVRQAFTVNRDTLAILCDFGLAALIIAALLYIMAARTAHHFDGWKCQRGDRSTINGRDLCPPHGRPT